MTVDDGRTPWPNGGNPFDVNGDGLVSPLDALVLINYLKVAADEGGPPADAELRVLDVDC